jgi:hypothetical protein
MLKLTLETNCIVAVDENRQPDADCIRRLLTLHDEGKVKLRLAGSSASERQRDLTYLRNFGQFKARVDALGLGHLERLSPPATWGVSYWGSAVWVSDEDVVLLEQIHTALFPGNPSDLQRVLAGVSDPADRATAEGKWRNRLMDVHALWCHLNYDGDVFVTTDGRYHRKRTTLAQIEPSLLILKPCDTDSCIRTGGLTNKIDPDVLDLCPVLTIRPTGCSA